MKTNLKEIYSNTLPLIKKINLTYLITGLIILCGIILRLKVYFYNQSFWYDECSLGGNILHRSYFFKLFKALDLFQVAPPFFMVTCKFLLDISHQVNNFYTKDLVLRLFPCICSIVSLPLFAILVQKMFKNRYFTWISTALLVFNPAAINYAQELKQYSCEMMFTIILLLAFLSLDIKNICYKKLALYSLLFTIAPWFSSSAWFVMAAGFVVTIIDMIKNKHFDKTKIAILFIPLIANFLVWALLWYKPVNKSLFDWMHQYWLSKEPSFLSFHNFSQMFVEKIQRLIEFPYPQYLFLFLFLNLIIFFTTREYRNKCYTLIPILLCITASFLEHYPFVQRLILFLLPLFIILYCQLVFVIKQSKLTTAGLVLLLAFVCINQFSVSTKRYLFHNHSFRNFALILQENANKDFSNVIFTTPFQYGYYLDLKSKNILSDNPWQDFEKSTIPEKITNFPKGDYWIEVSYSNKKLHYSLNLKKYIYSNSNLKVLKIWQNPVDETIYLIHFEKIE